MCVIPLQYKHNYFFCLFCTMTLPQPHEFVVTKVKTHNYKLLIEKYVQISTQEIL